MKRSLALPLTILVAGCMTYPDPPPITPNPPGSVYRAHGHEPPWSLTIDAASLKFGGPDVPTVAQPTPRVIVGFAGEIYQTPLIGVNIVHQQCADFMSNQTFRDRVQVTVDGRSYEGCGGENVGPATLSGTNWRVVAVNGRATPAGGEYYMNFEAARFAAKFGCNGMGADYRQNGETIVPGPVIGTRMACQDMSYEIAAGQVLSQPLRMAWSGTDRLRLSSGPQRTIDLSRSN